MCSWQNTWMLLFFLNRNPTDFFVEAIDAQDENSTLSLAWNTVRKCKYRREPWTKAQKINWWPSIHVCQQQAETIPTASLGAQAKGLARPCPGMELCSNGVARRAKLPSSTVVLRRTWWPGTGLEGAGVELAGLPGSTRAPMASSAGGWCRRWGSPVLLGKCQGQK